MNILAEVVTIAALAAVLLISAPPITLVAVALVLALVLVPIVLTRRSWERIGEDGARLFQQQLHVLQQSSVRSRTSRSPDGRSSSKRSSASPGASCPHQTAPVVGRRRLPGSASKPR